jgi:hypothetical protein
VYCNNCGTLLSTEARFCDRCGASRGGSTPSTAEARPLAPGVSKAFLIGAGVILLLLIALRIFSSYDQEQQKLTEEKRIQDQKNALDSPSATPLTPREHLQRAQGLLKQVNASDAEKSDLLFSLISDHVKQASTDITIKKQVDAVLGQMAKVTWEVGKFKIWNSSSAQSLATIDCRDYIQKRLKAPSTADWVEHEIGRWRGHPGYFLVTYTVDAENSFGAKLRNSYQCQVPCFTENSCMVTDMQTIR